MEQRRHALGELPEERVRCISQSDTIPSPHPPYAHPTSTTTTATATTIIAASCFPRFLLRLVLDLNAKFGRQAHLQKKENEAHEVAQEKGFGETDWIDDDDLRVLRGEQRKTGKAAPKRLTSTQIELVEALLAKHKDDVDAMVRDIKINTYQHSKGQLRKLIESYAHWGGDWEKTGVDFRAPKKSKGGKMGRA